MGAQKFMGAQKLHRGHDASASLRHPQMAPDAVVNNTAQKSSYDYSWELILGGQLGPFFNPGLRVIQCRNFGSENAVGVPGFRDFGLQFWDA